MPKARLSKLEAVGVGADIGIAKVLRGSPPGLCLSTTALQPGCLSAVWDLNTPWEVAKNARPKPHTWPAEAESAF